MPNLALSEFGEKLIAYEKHIFKDSFIFVLCNQQQPLRFYEKGRIRPTIGLHLRQYNV
jgi:hypothetical protein